MIYREESFGEIESAARTCPTLVDVEFGFAVLIAGGAGLRTNYDMLYLVGVEAGFEDVGEISPMFY